MESTRGLFHKRRSRRKDVTLRGIYICPTTDVAGSKYANYALDLKIENISKHGIGFRLITPLKVNVNDILQVKFVLECEKRVTVVRKDIVIKWTNRDFAGADFVEPIDDYESELDFYLSGKRLSIFDGYMNKLLPIEIYKKEKIE